MEKLKGLAIGLSWPIGTIIVICYLLPDRTLALAGAAVYTFLWFTWVFIMGVLYGPRVPKE